MKNTSLDRILASLIGYKRCGSIYYKENFQYILSGLAIDHIPTGCRILLYLLPLYTNFDVLHLSYSMPLPGSDGFISAGDDVEGRLVELAHQYNEQIDQLADLKMFSQHINKLLNEDNDIDESVRNAKLRFSYGQSLAILGDSIAAKREFDRIISDFSKYFLIFKYDSGDENFMKMRNIEKKFILEVMFVSNLLADGKIKEYLMLKKSKNLKTFRL